MIWNGKLRRIWEFDDEGLRKVQDFLGGFEQGRFVVWHGKGKGSWILCWGDVGYLGLDDILL